MSKLLKSLAVFCLAAALMQPSPGVAANPLEFSVTMDMFRNGKLMAETTFSFRSKGNQWTMQSKTTGTKGLARLVGLQEHSVSRGDWQGDEPRALNFERNVSAVKKFIWTAEFDRDRSEILSVDPDGESTLPLQPGVVDESTVGMLIRLGLEKGQDEWFFQVLDEDEIEQQHYKARPAENLQTALGCVPAIAVEKIRRAGSTRYTRTYHAQDYAFTPVLIEHGKKGGDHLESRLKKLEIDGKTISPGPGCS